MKFVQTPLAALSAIVMFFAIMIFPSAEGAVTVTTISLTDYNQITSSNEAAWSVVYLGGGTSGAASEEIRLARNTHTPTPGGGLETLTGNLTWSQPTDLEILISGAAKISARAASTIVGDLYVIRPFNQILIRVYDESIMGNTSDLSDLKINNIGVRDMFADGNGYPGQSDIISITNFGSEAPFSFNANWNPGSAASMNDQYVWIVALQNPSIPEPSSFVLIGFSFCVLLRRFR